jgi:hypothetical protein
MANRGTAARGRSQRRPDENGRRESVRMKERMPIETIEEIAKHLCPRCPFSSGVAQVASNFRSTNGKMPPERN